MFMQYFSHIDKSELLQHEYSQPPILPSLHFWWVVQRQGTLSYLVSETCIQTNRGPTAGIGEDQKYVFLDLSL